MTGSSGSVEISGFRKPSYSANGGSCVEVGFGPGVVGVRDTKDRAGGQLVLAESGWAVFLREVRRDGIRSSGR